MKTPLIACQNPQPDSATKNPAACNASDVFPFHIFLEWIDSLAALSGGWNGWWGGIISLASDNRSLSGVTCLCSVCLQKTDLHLALALRYCSAAQGVGEPFAVLCFPLWCQRVTLIHWLKASSAIQYICCTQCRSQCGSRSWLQIPIQEALSIHKYLIRKCISETSKNYDVTVYIWVLLIWSIYQQAWIATYTHPKLDP